MIKIPKRVRKAADPGTTFFIEDSYPKFSIFWRGATGLVNFMGAKTPKIAFFVKNFPLNFLVKIVMAPKWVYWNVRNLV